MSEKNKQFQVRLPPELKSRLAAAASREKRSMSNFTLLAIEAACTKAEERANNNQEDRKK